MVSRIQRDILWPNVQFCYSNSNKWLLSLLLNYVKLFYVICASLTFFPYCSIFILSCITDMGLSFLPLESFEVTVTKEGDKGFFLSLLWILTH